MRKLNIADLDKLKITKVRPWCVNFTYDEQRYFLHKDSYEDLYTKLYKKDDKNNTYISKAILLEPYDFIRVKKGIKPPKMNIVYNQIDKEYFVKKLTRKGVIDSLFQKDIDELNEKISFNKEKIRQLKIEIDKKESEIRKLEYEFYYGNCAN